MPSNTLIYYRGYATNNAGLTGYSSDGTFSTTLKANGETCSSGAECSSTRCYVDNDNDGYAPVSGTATCHASAQLAGTDCYDYNAEARPGQTNAYYYHRGDYSFDYNCSNGEEVIIQAYQCINKVSANTCYVSDDGYGCSVSSGVNSGYYTGIGGTVGCGGFGCGSAREITYGPNVQCSANYPYYTCFNGTTITAHVESYTYCR
jgi:hypothetical protein